MTYQHASFDTLSVAISVALSFLGCFAALVSAIRIPLNSGRRRLRWIMAASVSLGGGAIWSMHFIGMAAYHLGTMGIVYNVPLTALSLVIAVAASALGIGIVGTNPRSLGRVLGGGVTAGLGIAAMHYTGMAAMQTGSRITYDPTRVVLSIGIAIGAALAALVIAFRVRSRTHVVLASVIMTAAVCGMHYTAMTAVRVEHMDGSAPMTGADPHRHEPGGMRRDVHRPLHGDHHGPRRSFRRRQLQSEESRGADRRDHRSCRLRGCWRVFHRTSAADR